ncbi:MAG: hypothetical protein ACLGH7_09505 [Actinomycetes bacterium]
MKKLTLEDLDNQQVELVPARETLHLDASWAGILAGNSSTALNLGSFFSNANSTAYQTIAVMQ